MTLHFGSVKRAEIRLRYCETVTFGLWLGQILKSHNTLTNSLQVVQPWRVHRKEEARESRPNRRKQRSAQGSNELLSAVWSHDLR
jgi:hypothetical protein